jgi:hypothetical protein
VNARTIKLLLEYLPTIPDVNPVNHYQDSVEKDFDREDVGKFVRSYADLSIGWKAAKQLANSDVPFPAFIEGSDDWVFRAYLYCLNPVRYKSEHISGALALASSRMKNSREVINSMLIQDMYNYASIEADTSIHRDTIAAYEKLFYNVVDRHLDHMFIRNVVYPNGRFVEIYDRYLDNEELGNILLRIGYNNGRSDVLHFAGFKSGLLGSLTSMDMPQKLESIVMANGYILARNGWANQREHAVGLSSARNLIAAAKHGGESAQQSSSFTPYGDALMAEVIRVKGEQLSARPIIADALASS